ncbi:hypothetical protein DFH28DRAFT_978916 [Melampsora americana]|nr:hypothetical protein DFH28DRAFT_978916 [Melampsora americana]
MSSSNVLAQSTTPQSSVVTEDLKSAHPFIGPGVFFHGVSFTTNDGGSGISETPRTTGNDLLERLEAMTIQKSPQSSKISARQKKPTMTPYYRKPRFTQPRTPEIPRQHRRRRNPAMNGEIKEPSEVGKATQ